MSKSERRWVAVSTLLLVSAVPGIARAQGSGSFQFLPSVAFLASISGNPLALPDSASDANYVNMQAELPFQFNGPRWNGRLSLQPGYQKYRSEVGLDSFQNAATLSIDGLMSRRSRLRIDGYVLRGDSLRSQLGADVILPRAVQLRAEGSMELMQQLSRRDSLSITGDYRALSYPDSNLVGSRGVSVGLAYGHSLSTRFGVTGSTRAQIVTFDSGNRARSISTTAGFTHRLAPRTTISLEAGALYVQEDSGAGFASTGTPGFSFLGELEHRTQHLNLGLRAWRDMGFTNGLGAATIRSQLTATVSAGAARWSLLGSGGVARNEPLATALAESATSSVDTWTGCVGGGLRLTRNFSAIGSFLFAHQIGSGPNTLLNIDSYRGAFGVMFQASPPGDSWKRGTGLDLDSVSRSANVTC